MGTSGPAYDLLIGALSNVLGGSSFGYTFLGLLLLMGALLYLNAVLARHRVFLRPGFVPAFVGLLLTALLPPIVGMPVWIWTLCLSILAMGSLMDMNSARGGRRTLYNAGFWTGLTVLMSFSSMPLIAAVLVGLAVLRPFKTGEWMVMLAGFLTPAYFSVALLFLTDLLPLAKAWPALDFVRPSPNAFGTAGWTAVAGSIGFIIAGVATSLRLAARSAISVRRIWLVLAIGSIVAALTALISTEGHDANALLLALPWLTPIVAAPAALEKKTRFGTFIFYALIVLVIAVHLL